MQSLRSLLGSAHGLVLGVAVLLGACSAKDGGAVEDLPASICPTCGPSAGGETGDFAGTPRGCEPLLSTVEVDEEEARSLGYDVAEMRRLLPRSIDVPMTWGPAPLQSVSDSSAQFEIEPASGYALDETRISLDFHASPVLRYERIDPKYCDGATCSNGTISVQAGHCEALHIDLEIELHTADDAVRGRLTGRATQSAGSRLRIWASAELASIAGKMHLSPKTDLGPMTGNLVLAVVNLGMGRAEGNLTPTMRFNIVMGEGVYPKLYLPVMGRFVVDPVDTAR